MFHLSDPYHSCSSFTVFLHSTLFFKPSSLHCHYRLYFVSFTNISTGSLPSSTLLSPLLTLLLQYQYYLLVKLLTLLLVVVLEVAGSGVSSACSLVCCDLKPHFNIILSYCDSFCFTPTLYKALIKLLLVFTH